MALREQLEYTATAATLNFSRILPERAVYALFRGFALLMHAVIGRRRRISLLNVGIAFPEKSAAEREALVKKSYVNLSEDMALNTLIMTGRISNERLISMVEPSDWDKMVKLQANNSKKGLLVISAHLGNWELMLQYAALRSNTPIHAIARKTNNQLLEERVVMPLRERFGIKVFYKKNALMRIMKAINRGESAGLMVDQKLGLQEGVPIKFFGKEAGTTAAPALLQIRFGVTTVPMFMVKSGHQRYRFIVGDPVQWNDNGSPMEEQVLELTGVHQQLIEDTIRHFPDQWFWMHNRWGLPKVK